MVVFLFFFSSRRRHTRYWRDWSSDVCSSDLLMRCVACAIVTHGPPVERRTNGQSSIAPEITAVASRRPLLSFLTNSSKERSTEIQRHPLEPNIIIQPMFRLAPK